MHAYLLQCAKSHRLLVTIHNITTPINYSESEKKTLYDQLQTGLWSIPKHEMKIMIGNIIVKVGNDNESYDRPMDKEGCFGINDNENCLIIA